ncbi:hypothetical protein ACOME3_007426 [Neoechinorhynchus agilis]
MNILDFCESLVGDYIILEETGYGYVLATAVASLPDSVQQLANLVCTSLLNNFELQPDWEFIVVTVRIDGDRRRAQRFAFNTDSGEEGFNYNFYELAILYAHPEQNMVDCYFERN